jgi:D-threo-aldose 1-dehydrogenase
MSVDATQRIPLGNGVAVSRLGLGGGSLASAAGEEGVRAVADAAWAAGLRHFDTAAFYAGTVSEQRLGRVLAGRPRGEYVLSTKLGRFMGADGADVFDYTAAGTEAAVRAALARLCTGRLDVVFLHDISPELHGEAHEAHFRDAIDRALPVLRRFQADGVIGLVGAAMRNHEALLRCARAAAFDVFMLAGHTTLLSQAAWAEFLPLCAREGRPVLCAAPFETGLLATGPVPGARYRYKAPPEEMLARAGALQAVCARHGVTLAAAAIQFPLRHRAIASVVVGHQSPAEVARNMALLAEPIPAALWEELRAEGLLSPSPPPG